MERKILKNKKNLVDQRDVGSIHAMLFACWEKIHSMFDAEQDPSAKTCLAIIEDDLDDLIWECEEYLLGDSSEQTKKVDPSFEVRSATVLEEVSYMLERGI